MKTLTVFAVALLSAGVVFADAASAAEAGKTRAQVIAELANARASGELEALNSDNPAFFLRTPAASAQSRTVAAPATVAKTRAQVIAELHEAQRSGELAALNSEDPLAYPRFAANRDAQKKAAETLAE